MNNIIKNLSLITCGVLLASNLSFADSINDAFKKGTISGDITLYTDYTDEAGSDKEGLTAGTMGLGYETASYMGISAKAGFRAGHVFDGDDFENDALMTEAYFKYSNEYFALMIGRQAIDLEWIGDYNESVVGVISAIPDTTVVLGYVDRQAAADEDEIGTFTELTDDGAYVVDAKYTGVEGLALNPYIYSAPDAVNFYGLKATYTTDMFGILAHYAKSNVDTGEDGSLLALEASTSFSSISAALGYIKTDDDGGLGLIDTYGDNYNPMDDGSAIGNADADMIYGSLGYSISNLDLGALYSVTDVGSNDEKELNLTAGYSITDSLSASLLYVDIDSDVNVDKDYGSLTITYSF